MLTIDIVLLVIVLGAGIIGLFKGFVKSVGMLVGGILSIVLSTRFYTVAASWLPESFATENMRKFLGFIICFIILNLIFGLAVELLSKIFQLPVINMVNRVLGFGFGVIEAVLVLGTIFMFLTKYPITYNLIKNLIENSFMVPFLISAVNVITPLLPEALREMPTLPAEVIPATPNLPISI